MSEHSPDEAAAWLRLTLEPDLTPAVARQLLAALGLPQQVFAAGRAALAAQVDGALASRWSQPPHADVADAIARALAWAEQPGNHLITLADASYPQTLLAIHDPPPLLYVIGDPACLSRPALAVVGARSASAGGMDNARAFARHLAAQGWCVTSGLAQGIDAAAHEGALAAGLQGGGTVAVIATGADIVYPARNRALAHRIAAGGAIVSELPLGTPAQRFQFPRRNRLVAGLSQGVLVVEAAVHSGSLITARLAGETGREVFAIPGSIHSPLSRGCHALIRQGAKLVETAQDILDELGAMPGPSPQPGSALTGMRPSMGQGWDSTPSRKTVPRRGVREAAKADDATQADLPAQAADEAGPDASDSESANTLLAATDTPAADALLTALGHDPVHLDDLQRRTALPSDTVQAALLMLELAGHVVRLDGGRYERATPSHKHR